MRTLELNFAVALSAAAIVACLIVSLRSDGVAPPPSALRPGLPIGQLVTQRDVDSYPPGSAQGALLRWWRAAQRGDTAGVRRWMTPSAARWVSARELASRVRHRGPGLGYPAVVRLRLERSRVIAYVLALSYIAEDREPVGAVPLSVSLKRTGEGWRVSQMRPLDPPGKPR